MNDGALRGILLVGLAVVVGAVLLGSGLDDTQVASRPAASSDADTGLSDEGGEPADTVPSPDEVDPATVSVVVANGSGISGAAGTVTDLLIAGGYTLAGAPTDASERAQLDTVYYAENAERSFQPEAEAVAAALGLDVSAVQPLPDPTAPPPEMGLASVLVVLGSAPTGLAATTTPG